VLPLGGGRHVTVGRKLASCFGVEAIWRARIEARKRSILSSITVPGLWSAWGRDGRRSGYPTDTEKRMGGEVNKRRSQQTL
jgi:hypothetical protein